MPDTSFLWEKKIQNIQETKNIFMTSTREKRLIIMQMNVLFLILWEKRCCQIRWYILKNIWNELFFSLKYQIPCVLIISKEGPEDFIIWKNNIYCNMEEIIKSRKKRSHLLPWHIIISTWHHCKEELWK